MLPLPSLALCCAPGYETTSLTLSYTLYELAQHPHMQQRIRQEVRALGWPKPRPPVCCQPVQGWLQSPCSRCAFLTHSIATSIQAPSALRGQEAATLTVMP